MGASRLRQRVASRVCALRLELRALLLQTRQRAFHRSLAPRAGSRAAPGVAQLELRAPAHRRARARPRRGAAPARPRGRGAASSSRASESLAASCVARARAQALRGARASAATSACSASMRPRRVRGLARAGRAAPRAGPAVRVLALRLLDAVLGLHRAAARRLPTCCAQAPDSCSSARTLWSAR